MATFETSHGTITVTNWAYQLQGNNGTVLTTAPLANSEHDLVVIDRSRDGSDATLHTVAQINAIKNKPGGAVAVSYVSIGEASDFRDSWDPAWTTNGLASGRDTALAPSWLGPINPDWPESRKVRYWDSDWQDTLFNDQHTGAIDTIVAQGFDAAYLDIVDAYYYWAVEAPARVLEPGDPRTEKDAAGRMIDFIVDMTAHARETNPHFFVIPQNGGFIIDALEGVDAARKAAFLDSIGAIGVEDVYLRAGNRDENNGFRPDEALIRALKRDFLDNGKMVLAVDYVNDHYLMGKFIARALADGFTPCVAFDRELDQLSAPVVTAGEASAAANIIAGTSASDTIDGLAGADILFGFEGNDTLLGGADNDVLLGGLGSDTLRGGTGADTFDFNEIAETGVTTALRDSILDFERGLDKINLHTMDANSATAGNQNFKWIADAAFHGKAGELRYNTTSEGVLVSGDVNGDGVADFQITVKVLSSLVAGDFVV